MKALVSIFLNPLTPLVFFAVLSVCLLACSRFRRSGNWFIGLFRVAPLAVALSIAVFVVVLFAGHALTPRLSKTVQSYMIIPAFLAGAAVWVLAPAAVRKFLPATEKNGCCYGLGTFFCWAVFLAWCLAGYAWNAGTRNYEWEDLKLTGVPGEPVFAAKLAHPFLAEYVYRVTFGTNSVSLPMNTGGQTLINVYRLPATNDVSEYVIFEERYNTSFVCPTSSVVQALRGGVHGQPLTLSRYNSDSESASVDGVSADSLLVQERAIPLGVISNDVWKAGCAPAKIDIAFCDRPQLSDPPEDPNAPWPVQVPLAGLLGNPVYEANPYGNFHEADRRIRFADGFFMLSNSFQNKKEVDFNLWRLGKWIVAEQSGDSYAYDSATHETRVLVGGRNGEPLAVIPFNPSGWGYDDNDLKTNAVDAAEAVYLGHLASGQWTTNRPPLTIPQTSEEDLFSRYRFPH
jgi:hypothetical protein